MNEPANVIAVDGPSASGKGTLSRRLAAHLGYAHLDTGKLYRAVALALLADRIEPDDEAAASRAARNLTPDIIARGALADPALAREDVGGAASVIARFSGVRDALYDLQRDFAAHPPNQAKGAVLDGRDIGTVICPEAGIKFFISASAQVRAARRHKELLERDETRIYAHVLADIAERDRRDATRPVAPLKAAPDAIEIDTSSLDADQVFALALRYIAEAGNGGASRSD